MRLRPFGILTARHALLGRIPDLARPHVEVDLPGAVYGTDLWDVTLRAAKVRAEAGSERVVPWSAWLGLSRDQRERLRREGFGLPVMAGAGQQESWRAVGPSFAITSTIHAHIKIAGGAAQQATWCMSEASFDGTSGIATLEFDTSTEATAGTVGTAPTVTQVRRYPSVTPGTTVTGNLSAEGTTYTAINVLLLPMPTAPWIIQYPLGRELETQPAATTIGKALLMRGSTTVNCNMRGMIEFEE